jgi:peptidoglycan/xylan/chitin deacetylase (PgdA/CDA1 family)
MLPAVSRVAAWAGRQPAFQVLMYHRVNDDGDPFFPALPVPVFEAQIRYLARTYTVHTVEELAERMKRGRIPRDAIAITFDDGYRDNLTQAAPILARHALPATIFLATAHIGSRRRLWFDEVAQAFKTTRADAAVLPWGRVTLRAEAERVAALDEAWARLKRAPEASFSDTLDRVLDALAPFDRDGGPANGMLDWEEVDALSKFGFTLGAHTATHPILSRVSAARARREIEESRDTIRAQTGRTPVAFAYPNGGAADYTDEVASFVRDAGFTCGVTTRFGSNTAATSPWQLRRGGPWEHHLPTFALKLAGYRLKDAWT